MCDVSPGNGLIQRRKLADFSRLLPNNPATAGHGGSKVKIERIAKLGGTGRSWSDGSEGRSTAGDTISGHDIAAAMGMANLSRAQTLLIYRDHAHDYAAQNALYYALEVECMGYAVEGNWKFPTGARMFRRLVKLAVAEIVLPMRCGTCRGIGELQTGIESKPMVCEDCGGTGKIVLRDYDRANILEIAPENYSRTWRERYEKLIDHMRQIGDEALRKTMRRI